jgi:hypothetical protein
VKTRNRALAELAVCSAILVFFVVVAVRYFAAPSELLEDTIFSGLSAEMKIVLGRVMLIACNAMGIFFTIRSLRSLLASRKEDRP